MVVIEFKQSLSNSDLYEHRCLKNIKNLYKTAGKFQYQQQYKEMIEVEFVSTSEVFTNKSTTKPNPSVSTKNPSSRKSLHQFTETLDVKHKTAVWRFGAAKAKRKANKEGNVLW